MLGCLTCRSRFANEISSYRLSLHRLLSSSRAAATMIRLSKRMSELDLCSRREADELLKQHNKVLVRGIPAVLGQKVLSNETEIEIVDDQQHHFEAVVLNKPKHYVSGQPENGNVPAVKLLTRNNGFGDGIEDLFDKKETPDMTLQGYAPAGRLDKESTGLLVFARSGVLAKKLLSGRVEKEYRVELGRAHRPTALERERGLLRLPSPSEDLALIQTGGARLVGDDRPLLPAKARWLVPGKEIRLILREGRKHQIRRMCRELLGLHVMALERKRIGPIHVKDLPQGKWRPLTQTEVDLLLESK